MSYILDVCKTYIHLHLNIFASHLPKVQVRILGCFIPIKFQALFLFLFCFFENVCPSTVEILRKEHSHWLPQNYHKYMSYSNGRENICDLRCFMW